MSETLKGSGDEAITSSPRHQASVVQSTVKAKPQGSARQFCHRVPRFLFLQNRDKTPPPIRGAMGHSIPWGTQGWSKAAWDRDVVARCRQQLPRALGAEPALCIVSLSNWENMPTTLGLGGQWGQSQDALTAQIPDHSLHPHGQAGWAGSQRGILGVLVTVCVPWVHRMACATTTSLRCWPRSRAMSMSPPATSQRSKLPSTSTAPWLSASTPRTRPSPSTPTASTMSPSVVRQAAHGAREGLGAQVNVRAAGSHPCGQGRGGGDEP